MAKKQDDAIRAKVARWKATREVAEPGDTLQAEPMAKALGMTWRNLKKIIDLDAAFPIVVRGAEGHAWTFDVTAVLDHMIARDEAVLAERDREASRLARLSGITVSGAVGGPDSAGASQGMSAEALRSAAQTMLQVQKLKREQGLLIEAEPVRMFLIEYHQRFQQEVLGALGRVDPAGQLPPATRTLIENDMRNLLVDMHGRLEQWMGQHIAADRPAGP